MSNRILGTIDQLVILSGFAGMDMCQKKMRSLVNVQINHNNVKRRAQERTVHSINSSTSDMSTCSLVTKSQIVKCFH